MNQGLRAELKARGTPAGIMKYSTGVARKAMLPVRMNGAAKPAMSAAYPPSRGPTIHPRDRKLSLMPMAAPKKSLSANRLHWQIWRSAEGFLTTEH